MFHRNPAAARGIPKIQSMSIVDNKRLSSIISSKTATKPGWSWRAGRSRPFAPAAWASRRPTSASSAARSGWLAPTSARSTARPSHLSGRMQSHAPLPAAPRRNQQADRQSQEKGYTLIPINLHFSKGRVKLEIGLAKGKKDHDKRAAIKDQENQRDAADAMKKVGRAKRGLAPAGRRASHL